MKKFLPLLSTSLFFISTALVTGQTCFDAGTGADGAYSASANASITGGTYNYTSFHIDAGVVVNVVGTQPLVINCIGNVIIDGSLTANGGNGVDAVTYVSGGTGGIGVAGGANGGNGTFSASLGPLDGSPGAGSGGGSTQGMGWSGGGGAGYATVGTSSGGVGGLGGPVYGDVNISGFEAGSGGGGGSGGYNCGSGGGGAGGGIIRINAGGSINIGATGLISANGGNGGSDGTGNCGGGGGGSGGSIILASPTIVNNGTLQCIGGTGGASAVAGSPYFGAGGLGAVGRIRIDHNAALSGSGTFTPAIGSEFPVNSPPVFVTVAAPNDSICSGTNLSLYGNGNAASYTWSGGITDSVAFTPASSLTYTVTATAAGGCTATSSISITVLPLPTISYTANPNDSICEGNLLTLSGTGGNNYSWTGGITNNVGFTPLTFGTFTATVTGTDAFGCSNTDTATFVVNPLPTVNLGPDILQPNPPAILDAGAGFSSYLWNTSATTATISVTSNGTYWVNVTDANGCSNSDTIQVTFTTGINDPMSQVPGIFVYPNPNNGIMQVTIQNIQATNIQLNIIDLTGKLIKTTPFYVEPNTHVSVIDLTELNNGIYILQATGNHTMVQQRFIIQK
jgi:hypothetical protein